MTIIHVEVVHTIASTTAWPQPHVVQTERTILRVVDGGPCQSPVTVVSGDSKTVLPCSRHEPSERQCDACQTTIVESVTRLRYTGPHMLCLDEDGWLCELIQAGPHG